MECSESAIGIQVNANEILNDVNSSYTNGETENDESIKEENNMFSCRSISVTASSIGISSLSDDVCRHIAAELYYKTKELIHMSKLILLQNKRSTLTTNDVKKAMRLLGGVEIYGHDSKEQINFIHIPKADVFIEENPELDIVEDALTDNSYSQKGDPFIKGTWIMPEGYSQYSQDQSVSPSTYYQQIAKTIMTGGPAHIKVALRDLRTNPKIGSVCPFLLNFFLLTVQKFPRDIQLTNALISTVHAIAHNKYVDPSPFRAVNRAVKGLVKIVTEVNKDENEESFMFEDDDLTVRIRAGLLLAKVSKIWNIELKQQIEIVKHLFQRLLDPSIPLQSQFGSIVTLAAFGQKVLDFRFWLLMEKYIPQLVSKMETTSEKIMVQHIALAIVVAGRSIYKKELITNAEELKQLFKVDQMIYSDFGDSVNPLRMIASPPIVKCVRTQIIPSRLKLKLFRPEGPNPHYSQKLKDVRLVFDAPPRLTSHISKNVHSEHKDYKKPGYAYVQRNYKFCKPLYKNSAAGDLLLVL